MNWDLIEDNWKQVRNSLKQNRDKFNGDSLDDIDDYRHQPRNGIKQWQVKVPSESGVIAPPSTKNKSNFRKKL